MKNYRKEIVYPIFIKVSQSTTDIFWVYLYEDLAYGICPFGTYIDSDAYTINCNFKGKQFIYSFKNKLHSDILTELTHLFTIKLNIFSKIDYLKNRTNFGKGLQLFYSCWKDIKKKSIKDILIENFVLSLQKQYDLSSIQTKKLLSIINMAFTFKLISNNSIIYDASKCVITNIDGLDFHKLLTKNMALPSINITKIEKISITDKVYLKELWKKFIEYYQ